MGNGRFLEALGDPPPTSSSTLLQMVRRDLALALLAILFFFLPLYRTGLLEDSFLTPKLALVQALSLAIAAALLASRTVRNPPKGNSGVTLLLLGFLAANLASFAWAESKPLAITAGVYFGSFTALYVLCLHAVRTAAAVRVVMLCGIAAATVTAGWTVFEDATHGAGSGVVARLPDWRGHLSAGLGNSGHIAGYIGLFLPAAILEFLTASRLRWLLGICITAMFAALIVTWSVGSTGATLISLGVWWVIAVRTGLGLDIRWKRLALLFAAGGALTAFYLLPHAWNPHQPSLWAEAFGSERWAEGWPTRVAIWQTTWHMIQSSPVLGIGAGNFTFQYVQQVVPGIIADPLLRPYAGAFTNDAHNDYLQVWCETGLPGLLFYAALLVVFFRSVFRKLRTASRDAQFVLVSAGAGVTVFALDSMMSFPMWLPAHIGSLMFFLAVPGAITTASISKMIGRRKTSSVVGLYICVAALVVFGFIHGRRVLAEYHLKAARSAAESELVVSEMGPSSQWQTAEIFYRQGLEALSEGSPELVWKPLFEKARMFTGSPLFRATEKRLRKSLSYDPHYGNASSRLGMLLIFSGRYEEARQVSRKTLKTLQAYEIHERMGAASFLLGDTVTARTEWQICKLRFARQALFYKGLLQNLPQSETAP